MPQRALIIGRAVTDNILSGEPLPADHILRRCCRCNTPTSISPSGAAEERERPGSIIACTDCGYEIAKLARAKLQVTMTTFAAGIMANPDAPTKVLDAFLDLTKDKAGGNSEDDK